MLLRGVELLCKLALVYLERLSGWLNQMDTSFVDIIQASRLRD